MHNLAWAARYGHQPISEMLAMTRKDFETFCEELEEIVHAENAKDDDHDEG